MRAISRPVLPNPGPEYSQLALNRFRNTLDLFFKELLTPGAIRGTDLYLGTGQEAAQATCHIAQPALGSEVQRIESAATNDDVSERVIQNRVTTADATVTTIHTFTIPASTTFAIEAMFVARRTGGTAGTADDGAWYRLFQGFNNLAGTATAIGSAVKEAGENQAGWDVNFSASGATVLARVTGAVNNSIVWHMTARTYRVSS